MNTNKIICLTIYNAMTCLINQFCVYCHLLFSHDSEWKYVVYGHKSHNRYNKV